MSQSIELKLATLADATLMAFMSRDLIETGLGWAWTPSRVTKSIRRSDTASVVARLGSQMIGFAVAQFGDEEANLNLLAVRQDCQRLGIGRRLVVWLEESARVAGVSVVRLQVRAANVAAQRFYQRLGYREFGRIERYYAGRESATLMAHDLWEQPHAGSGAISPRRHNGASSSGGLTPRKAK